MPDIEQNLEIWNKSYEWPEAGEEWSEAWGNSESQWFGTIMPRIQRFLPARSILEIAPGRGRWTNFLRRYCDQLSVVDLSPSCIEICESRFRNEQHISYHINDGTSLEMIDDRSIDFVFSFDSLVHAELEVLQKYLEQIERKLTENGAVFFHHSNAGAYAKYFSFISKLPSRLIFPLAERGLVDVDHWRASDVSAAGFEDACRSFGLQCISQELINWHSHRLIDSLSIAVPKASGWARQNVVRRNPNFMLEAKLVKGRSAMY